MEKEFWVDFQGSVLVRAENAEEAETIAREKLDTYWNETNPVHYMTIENIEEHK